MDVQKMDEFRSNLLLLLQCGHPEGLPINLLKMEYKQYFMEDTGPELILPKGLKNSKHWDALFQLKEFREDFALFYINTVVYVKAIRKRSYSEMKLIAQLAKHSHLNLARKAEFRCGCCSHDIWRKVAKDAEDPNSNSTVVEVIHTQTPEDIIVKIEPHQMLNNGDDDSNSRGANNAGNDGLYSLVQQAHGNHPNSYVNGGTIHSNDPSAGSSASTMSNNTNDGFMLDHQLRVQEHPQGQTQSLQAFASLLNSAGSGNHTQIATTEPGGSGSQPFYTFVIQNGEIKVMQIVSSAQEGQPTNGDTSITTSANMTISSPVATARKSHPQKRGVPDVVHLEMDAFFCSMPGCGEKFEVKQHLQNHERTCSLKKYPCTFVGCDRRFKNSKQRHAHMTSRHKGTENAFHCTVPECTAVFKTLDRLKVHESRCRFKYEQFQLMDVEAEAVNNNKASFASPSQSLVPNLNSSSESVVEPHPASPNAAFASLQAASTISEGLSVPGVHIPSGVQIKIENGSGSTVTPDLQGFSTIDLSLVKSEIME